MTWLKGILSQVWLSFAWGYIGRSLRFDARERHLGHRLDVRHIQLLEFADVVQDFVKLGTVKLRQVIEA